MGAKKQQYYDILFYNILYLKIKKRKRETKLIFENLSKAYMMYIGYQTRILESRIFNELNETKNVYWVQKSIAQHIDQH